MPLKHLTETVLVLVLAACAIATGIALAFLPPFPDGFLYGLLLTGITLAYPLALYPILRRSRADYEFRVLHLAPFFLMLLWMIGQLLGLRFPSARSMDEFLTWGFSLLPVAIIFAFLVVFCINVLRRRERRLALLALLFLPFAFIGLVSEKPEWSRSTMAWLGLSSSSTSVAAIAEEPLQEWGARLETDLERAKKKLVEEELLRRGSSSSRPPHLPSSGPGFDLLVLSSFAVYCAILHKRARARMTM